MSLVHQGHLFTDTGQMTALNGAAGVPAAAFLNGGWAHHANGSPYVENLVASAVPGTAIRHRGLAFHADGRLYVTTEAVASADAYVDGQRVRTDGALRISTAAVDAGDSAHAGWAFKQTGEARMSVT